MATTAFTGPIVAGNVLNSDGSGNLAGLGGSCGTQNVGFAKMSQISVISQASAAAATSIVIPAGSLIVGIDLFITTGWTNTATLGIGISSNANELASGLPTASLVQGKYSVPVTVSVANWLAPNNLQDSKVWVKSSAAPSGGTGAATLVVHYLQAINTFVNGQYT